MPESNYINFFEKFMAKISIPKNENDCWNWIGNKYTSGYGYFNLDNKGVQASRLSYRVFYGVEPGDLHVCHHCDNPPCVNPAHLFLGTRHDNMKDMIEKNGHHKANRTHCKFGHEYSAENTKWETYKKLTYRVCLTCRKIAYEKNYEKRKDEISKRGKEKYRIWRESTPFKQKLVDRSKVRELALSGLNYRQIAIEMKISDGAAYKYSRKEWIGK